MDRTRLALAAVTAVLALPLVTAVHHTDRTPCGDRFDSTAGHRAGPAAGLRGRPARRPERAAGVLKALDADAGMDRRRHL
ncbi:hypothetical protein [Streptomyces violascens]|uniref:hypothetical protein n=1 Tax=Streptomyces violascens TaxID=67381 RepID=UPI003661EBD2